MKHLKLFENYYSEMDEKLKKTTILRKEYDNINKNMDEEYDNYIEIITDIVKSYGEDVTNSYYKKEITLNYKMENGRYIRKIKWNNDSTTVDVFDKIKEKSYHNEHFKGLGYLDMAGLMDYFKEKYPEYFEGKGMGFFDLKNENHIEDFIKTPKKLDKFMDIMERVLNFVKKYNKNIIDLNNYEYIFDVNTINNNLIKLKYNITKLTINNNKVSIYYKLNGENKLGALDWGTNKHLLACVLDAIEKNYPEFLEGDNMGFFDLKNESKVNIVKEFIIDLSRSTIDDRRKAKNILKRKGFTFMFKPHILFNLWYVNIDKKEITNSWKTKNKYMISAENFVKIKWWDLDIFFSGSDFGFFDLKTNINFLDSYKYFIVFNDYVEREYVLDVFKTNGYKHPILDGLRLYKSGVFYIDVKDDFINWGNLEEHYNNIEDIKATEIKIDDLNSFIEGGSFGFFNEKN